MDWSLIFTIVGFFVANLLTIIIGLAAHGRWQQSRLDSRFKDVWDANDKRVVEIGDVRKDFQGAIARIEHDLSGAIKLVADALNNHRIEDAKTYVSREELAGRIEALNGEIKGLRDDVRHGNVK